MKKWLIMFTALLLMMFTSVTCIQAASQQDEIENAFEEAQKVQQVGPAEITLLDQAQLKLPADFVFIPQPQAGKLMRSMGNRDNPALVGLIFPTQDGENWMVAVKYQDSGYIKDDDAKNWNVDDMFKSIKEGTEEANKERKQRGIPELEIIGWVEKPQYDAVHHQLIWSISAKDKGAADNNDCTINYNTYVLGREGYLTLNLITDLAAIEAQKPVAAQLLQATNFAAGKRYEDFNASTDKIAEYGLAALIAGAAAKKLGFFALIAAFAAKFAKLIGLAVLGAGSVLMKLFRKDKKEDASNAAPPEN